MESVMSDLPLLQLLRVKGLVDAAGLAAASGISESEVQAACERWAAEGLVSSTPRGWRLTGPGREHLAGLLADERAGLDQGALTPVYEAFLSPNKDLKAAITAWQMRDEATPNDHSDAAYDAGVIARIAQVDQAIAPILAQLAELAPRLSRYRLRLSGALAKVQAGDHAFIARPIVDSYHTVWFELHEDLIAVTGRNRGDEAAAGRAA
jgi:pyruvate,orthophosphate dikinase